MSGSEIVLAQTALQPWSVADFFAWQDRQDDRYELVGGYPVRMMAGASNRHDRLVLNILVQLGIRLRGSSCTAFTGDGAVETRPGQIRRPDAGIDCGKRDPDGFTAAEPRAVFEVLSPSTRDFDTFEKLAEYKGVETLDAIVYVEPNRPEVAVWSRDGERRWAMARVEGPAGIVALPALGIELPLADLYEGVSDAAGPA